MSQHRTDPDQFTDILEGHKAILYKVASAYCRDPFERQDLVQEIAVQLWRAMPRFDQARGVRLSTWIYRIALNVAISFSRKSRTRAARVTPGELVEASTPPADPQLAALHEAINSLDPLNKALALLYLDGYSHDEIAASLGISAGNAAVKLSRLKDELRTRLVSKTTPISKGEQS